MAAIPLAWIMRRSLLTSAVLALCALASPAAAETGVAGDAELVLAVDVSRSMTPR